MVLNYAAEALHGKTQLEFEIKDWARKFQISESGRAQSESELSEVRAHKSSNVQFQPLTSIIFIAIYGTHRSRNNEG